MMDRIIYLLDHFQVNPAYVKQVLQSYDCLTRKVKLTTGPFW